MFLVVVVVVVLVAVPDNESGLAGFTCRLQ
jgi:hypothetical protein